MAIPVPTRGAALLAVILLVVAFPMAAQPRVELRADFNTGPNSYISSGISYYGGAVAFGDRYVFTQTTAEHGTELWETDGTAINTRMLFDLCPGACDGLGVLPALHVEGGTLYFAGSDGRHGSELWSLEDGATTPILVADIHPGAGNSSPGAFARLSFTIGGTQVTRTYFAATRPDVGRELWRLANGVVTLERDLVSGPESSSPAAIQLCSTSRVCLTAVGPSGAREARLIGYGSTTGLPTSVEGVAGLSPGNGRSVQEMVAIGSLTYLTMRDLTLARAELHVFESAAGGSTLLDSGPGPNSILELTVNAGLFRAFYTREGQLKVTDGTVPGTTTLPANSVQALTRLGTRMLFTARHASLGRELYASDGTAAGTVLLRDIVPGEDGLPANGVEFSMLRSGSGLRAFLAYFDAVQGDIAYLWMTDGTPGGTVEIGANRIQESGYIRLLASRANTALFAFAPFASGDGEPWFTNGSAAGTVQLGVFRNAVGDSDAMALGSIRARAYASAFDGARTRVYGFDPASNDAPQVSQVVYRPIGQRLGTQWYVDQDDRLAVGDGTSGGTLGLGMLALDDHPDCFVEHRGHVYFVTSEGTPSSDVEIARSDGTVAGTRLMTDLSLPGERRVDAFCGSGRRVIAAVGERLLFVASPPNGERELFGLDAACTVAMVRDVRVGADSGFPMELVTLRDRPGLPDIVVFHADDGVFGTELWASDGTGQGTVRLADIHPGAGSASPQSMMPAGNRVFFTATDPLHGRELYVSDGTSAGTRRVVDLFAGPGSAFGGTDRHGLLAYGGGRLYFSATGSADPDCALYESDGTAAGTRCAYDTARYSLQAVGREALLLDSGALVFAAHRDAPANDGRELRVLMGRELLELDGADLVPGSGSSNPSTFVAAGRHVLFSARAAGVGRELFRLDAGDLARLFSDGFEP